MLLDGRYAPSFPDALTEMDSKALLYALDPYFWEGWEDLTAVAGTAACELAHTYSLVLLRPDSLAARKAEAVLDWLPDNGFVVVDCISLGVDRHQVRALWQYQWNNAIRERKEACDALMQSGPSLLLIIRSDTASVLPDSTAARFARLKGAADPALRRPGDLRLRLGHKSRMLSYLHSPDEPADFVRELAILLDSAQRRAVGKKITCVAPAVTSQQLAGMVASAYSQTAHNALDLAASLDRIQAVALSATEPTDRDRLSLLCLIDKARCGERVDWRDLFSLLDMRDAAYEPWDRITIAGHLIAMDLPGKRNVLAHPASRVARRDAG
ncbi:nucleoside-diphosphate kinase [Xanthomonas translucens pv. graminis]|uniref:nucleoside-diphosphate kinase n=1 Tax=Xanthomonas graminis TaxID=3390026 RepID=UPI0025413C64|nr:nucleoside-diphosphate kinase [Xanthomonas translucens]WIH04871.1 nucleoside-diphosphate kinase [Xanthomonas translucens pv. graminis]